MEIEINYPKEKLNYEKAAKKGSKSKVFLIHFFTTQANHKRNGVDAITVNFH